MEFGYLPDPTTVDFTLPPDHVRTDKVLHGREKGPCKLFVGLTGWREKGWTGDLYPPQMRPEQFLSAYADSFNCLEFNPSFYALPKAELISRWCHQTGASFRFFVKMWGAVSHEPDVTKWATPTRQFLDRIQSFEDRLGGVFMQFPPDFKLKDKSAFIGWLDQWPTYLKLDLEIRSAPLLWDEGLLEECQQRGINLVLTDVAGHRELMHQCLLQPRFLLRFVATGIAPIDEKRIEAWVNKIAQWAVNGLQSATIFCHEPDQMSAPNLARLFHHFIREKADAPFTKLPEIAKYASLQKDLFGFSK
jgi:uncharacterized protein YecE (DUF72 family)